MKARIFFPSSCYLFFFAEPPNPLTGAYKVILLFNFRLRHFYRDARGGGEFC